MANCTFVADLDNGLSQKTILYLSTVFVFLITNILIVLGLVMVDQRGPNAASLIFMEYPFLLPCSWHIKFKYRNTCKTLSPKESIRSWILSLLLTMHEKLPSHSVRLPIPMVARCSLGSRTMAPLPVPDWKKRVT